MARLKRKHYCNVCGQQVPSGICADCDDELGIHVYICESDKCRAEHVIIFHRKLEDACFTNLSST